MEQDFWALFFLTLIGSIVSFLTIILGTVFIKRIFLKKKYGIALFILFLCFFVALTGLCVRIFVLCYKDLDYVLNHTYIEEQAKVVDFMQKERDLDGNGQIDYRNPKFYLIEQDEYIVLHAKDVEINGIYIIRYYPNTKICEVVEKMENGATSDS